MIGVIRCPMNSGVSHFESGLTFSSNMPWLFHSRVMLSKHTRSFVQPLMQTFSTTARIRYYSSTSVGLVSNFEHLLIEAKLRRRVQHAL